MDFELYLEIQSTNRRWYRIQFLKNLLFDSLLAEVYLNFMKLQVLTISCQIYGFLDVKLLLYLNDEFCKLTLLRVDLDQAFRLLLCAYLAFGFKSNFELPLVAVCVAINLLMDPHQILS